MTDIEKIELFHQLFRGRNDAYGAGECVKEAITDAVIKGHLMGKRRIGRYPLSPEIMDGSGTWWNAADIDEDDLGLAIQYCEALEHIEIPCYIERSKSKGYHVWVFFSGPVEAKWARGLFKYAIDLLERDTDYRIKEVFPKQNSIKHDGNYGFGNYIYLPLFGADVPNGRTVFLDPTNGYKPHSDQWAFLQSIEKVTPQHLGEVMETNLIDFVIDTMPEEAEPSKTEAEKSFDPNEAAEYYLKRALTQADIGKRNDTGFWLACQLRDLGLLEAEVGLYMRRYTQGVPQGEELYTEKEAQATLKSAYEHPQREPAIPGLGKESRLPDEDTLKALNKLHLTDVGTSEAFALFYSEKFRFDYTRKKWVVFDGLRWRIDADGVTTEAIKEIAKKRLAAAALIEDDEYRKKAVKWALTSENRFRLSGGLELAQSKPPFPISTEQFDTDQYLLGCTNGVIDLRTGELRKGRQEDYIMKTTDLAYNPLAGCPRWLQFLDEIFLGNTELIDFIHRAIGYSLTGDISEQCLFICYGTGWNGKSKFLAILRALLGDYARNTPFSTFAEKNRDIATNDVAALAGVRLVTASETGESQRLNEARIKAMTGGDPITARFLYGEFFDYLPAYKVWLAVNHKPVIRGTDEGIWRRIRLIPFEASFKANPDPYIEEKLKVELEGILRWADEGCLKWRKERLGMVEKVKTATEEYRQESDVIAQFLAECTIETETAKVKASDLYEAYKKWCEETGEEPISGNAFGRRMKEKGYERVKAVYVHYIGIGLLDNSEIAQNQ
jgi:putative DNA primase/helicase